LTGASKSYLTKPIGHSSSFFFYLVYVGLIFYATEIATGHRQRRRFFRFFGSSVLRDDLQGSGSSKTFIFYRLFLLFMTWTGFAGFLILDLLTTFPPVNPFRALSNNMTFSSTGKAAHLPALSLSLLGGLPDEDVDTEQAALCEHGDNINAEIALQVLMLGTIFMSLALVAGILSSTTFDSNKP
jgi:hypothetical protein